MSVIWFNNTKGREKYKINLIKVNSLNQRKTKVNQLEPFIKRNGSDSTQSQYKITIYSYN